MVFLLTLFTLSGGGMGVGLVSSVSVVLGVSAVISSIAGPERDSISGLK